MNEQVIKKVYSQPETVVSEVIPSFLAASPFTTASPQFGMEVDELEVVSSTADFDNGRFIDD